MMTSYSDPRSFSRKASIKSTISKESTYPARFKQDSINSASAGVSSSSKSRSGRLITTGPFVCLSEFHNVDIPLLLLKGGWGWRLIHHEPEQAGLLHGLAKLLKIHWLLNIAIHPQLVTSNEILFLPGSGENRDWDGFRSEIALQLFQHLKTVNLRQFEIQKHKSGRMRGAAVRVSSPAEKEIQRFLPISGNFDMVRKASA